MKSYQPDFIKPSVFSMETVSAWFTKKGESIQDNFKIEGLNLGFNTDEIKEVIIGNRNFLANSIATPISSIAFANQVHGNEILEIKEGGIYDDIDGFITKENGLALAIQVADCSAVLLADENAGIISAVHAGWRGAEAGIVTKAVQKMKDFGADTKKLKVFLSPCISQSEFEVGEEVAIKFPDRFVDRTSFSKPHIDLRGFIQDQLLNAGVLKENIESDNGCTYSNSEFYSYRRDKDKAGRMMGIIKLNDPI